LIIVVIAHLFSLGAKLSVDYVVYHPYMLPGQDYVNLKNVQDEFDLNCHEDLYNYVRDFQGDSSDLHKIIFIDYYHGNEVFDLPKNKLICFKWEALKIPSHFYDPYYRVYTHDDDLVDGKKFFKCYYAVLKPIIGKIPSFFEKKFCTMVVGQWMPDRESMLEFFETKPLGRLEAYGRNPPKIGHAVYKGKIPGSFSSEQKLETIKNYRFCICFENTHTTKGYITEKIFDVFAAGCVPVYWGPENVTDYIPENCFIDYSKFADNEEMYSYLRSINEEQYEEYLANIRAFLVSDEAHLFSAEHFEELILEAIRD